MIGILKSKVKYLFIDCSTYTFFIAGIIAVSCAQRVSLYDRIDLAPKLLLSPSVILIWSFSDPIHPCLLLQAPTDVYSFQFCPSNPDIISAGCINGQIVLWDIAEYHEKLVSSNEKSQEKFLSFAFKIKSECLIVSINLKLFIAKKETKFIW